MNGDPRISIVVPSYNQGSYIGETLESILAQNYPNLELIVIDGGSTDNSVEVIRSFEKHFKYWVSEKDKGQSHAINKGMQHVTGELFNWINSDDVLEAGALQLLAKMYRSNPDKNLFLGKSRIFKNGSDLRNSGDIVFPNVAMTLGYGQVNQPGMFYKTETIRKFLPLNESLHMCMDLDLWMKYLLEFGQDKLAETDICLAGFRLHASSKTLSDTHPFRAEKDELYNRMFIDKAAHPLVIACKTYFYLWKADEFMLEQNYSASSECLEKVSFMNLSFSGKRRYLGIYRRLSFKQRTNK